MSSIKRNVKKKLLPRPGTRLFVVEDIAALIPRVLFVSRFERKRSVNEVEIQILQPEPVQVGIESRFHALGSMIGVP